METPYHPLAGWVTRGEVLVLAGREKSGKSIILRSFVDACPEPVHFFTTNVMERHPIATYIPRSSGRNVVDRLEDTVMEENVVVFDDPGHFLKYWNEIDDTLRRRRSVAVVSWGIQRSAFINPDLDKLHQLPLAVMRRADVVLMLDEVAETEEGPVVELKTLKDCRREPGQTFNLWLRPEDREEPVTVA